MKGIKILFLLTLLVHISNDNFDEQFLNADTQIGFISLSSEIANPIAFDSIDTLLKNSIFSLNFGVEVNHFEILYAFDVIIILDENENWVWKCSNCDEDLIKLFYYDYFNTTYSKEDISEKNSSSVQQKKSFKNTIKKILKENATSIITGILIKLIKVGFYSYFPFLNSASRGVKNFYIFKRSEKSENNQKEKDDYYTIGYEHELELYNFEVQIIMAVETNSNVDKLKSFLKKWFTKMFSNNTNKFGGFSVLMKIISDELYEITQKFSNDELLNFMKDFPETFENNKELAEHLMNKMKMRVFEFLGAFSDMALNKTLTSYELLSNFTENLQNEWVIPGFENSRNHLSDIWGKLPDFNSFEYLSNLTKGIKETWSNNSMDEHLDPIKAYWRNFSDFTQNKTKSSIETLGNITAAITAGLNGFYERFKF